MSAYRYGSEHAIGCYTCAIGKLNGNRQCVILKLSYKCSTEGERKNYHDWPYVNRYWKYSEWIPFNQIEVKLLTDEDFEI